MRAPALVLLASLSGLAPAVAQQPVPPPQAAPATLNQSLVLQLVDNTRKAYAEGGTELRLTNLRIMRKEALCSFGTLQARDWYGVVREVMSTNSGSAGLVVALPGLTLRTIGGLVGDGDFIKREDPLYPTLLTLKIGDRIAFHGRFVAGNRDCFSESSLTERGSVTAPAFGFRFTEVVRY